MTETTKGADRVEEIRRAYHDGSGCEQYDHACQCDDIFFLLTELERTRKELSEAREVLADVVQYPPTFRDYTGTDYDTCAFCRQPVENEWQQHAVECQWENARRYLEGT